MARSRRRAFWIGVELTLGLLLAVGLALALGALRVSRAEVDKAPGDELARQVTIFGIVSTPGADTIDANLVSIKPQLERLLPRHGFKLLDAQTKRIRTGESVACELKNDYRAEAFLVRPVDEEGRVQLRCELFRKTTPQFSTVVRTPINQLFFYEQALPDQSRLLIGVGVRTR
jgi:hypothetical protein